MADKHAPTTPARREAALRYQAAQLLRDAAAWGYDLEIIRAVGERRVVLQPSDAYMRIESMPSQYLVKLRRQIE